MTEKEIEDYLVWTVERAGGKAYKFQSPSNRGVADRIVCLPGGFVGMVELKKPGGRLSALQKLFAAKMVELDIPYACLNSKEKIDEFISGACQSPF